MATPTLSLVEIERLSDLVSQSDITHLSVKIGEASVVLRKAPPVLVSAPVVGEALPPLEPVTGGDAGISAPETGTWVTAPMVGVFHPAKKAVSVGNMVQPGQVVGLIESMKLMNDVTAEFGGRVVEIIVENGQPVQYGQRLFHLSAEEA